MSKLYVQYSPGPESWSVENEPDVQRTFTDVEIYDEEICADVEHFAESLWNELEYEIKEKDPQDSLSFDEVQLVVEPKADPQGVLCCYYFVNPASRSLFWLDRWEATSIFDASKGVDTLSHKGEPHTGLRFKRITGVLKRFYRAHWDLFPALCRVTPKLKKEAEEMIVHAICVEFIRPPYFSDIVSTSDGRKIEGVPRPP
ncbi:hypothetical protein ID866_5875 [Astraeus odoratus]|nr:hypothetical protein ID866_5875 [Astraeus odoratus]